MDKQKFSLQFSANKKINFLVIALLASIALAGIVFMLPSVQSVIINLTERVLHRTLRDHGKWKSAMTFFAAIAIAFVPVFCAVFFLSNPVANFVQRKINSPLYFFLFTVVPVFIFLWFVNFVFPSQSDDIGRKLGNFSAIIHSYMNWNSRFGELLLLLFGSWFSTTPFYAIVNAAVGTLVIFDFFVLVFARLPKLTAFDLCALSIEIVWLLVDSCFGSIFFWAAGSFNYLWAYAFILSWLLPFRFLVGNIFEHSEISTLPMSKNILRCASLFMLGIFAGWSQELGIVFWLLVLIAVVSCKIFGKAKIPLWAWIALVGFLLGWLVLYLAPGPRSRAVNEDYYSIGTILNLGFTGIVNHVLATFSKYNFFRECAFFAIFILGTAFINYKFSKIIKSIFIVAILFFAYKLCNHFVFLIICTILAIFYCRKENTRIAKSFFIFAALFFALILFTGALVQVGIPWRAGLHYSLIRLAMIWLCADLFFYLASQNAFCSLKRFATLAWLALCIVTVIAVSGECFSMRKKWDAMCASVEKQKAEGMEDVVVEAETFRSKWRNYGDWGNPGSDATVWPNTTYANYFGVKSYVAE